MEVKTIVCPNCGANVTNLKNCEYCGSILVRYIDKGVAIDEKIYGKNVLVIPGLEEELKKNLSLQEIRGENQLVITTMAISDRRGYQILESVKCNFGTSVPTSPFPNAETPSIALRVVFETRSTNPEEAAEEKRRLQAFKQNNYFFMFTPQSHIKGMYYYIDFGSDVENAVKVISAIVNENINIATTNFAFDTILIDEKDTKSYSGILVDDNIRKRTIWGWIAAGIAFIGMLLNIFNILGGV